MRGRLVAGVRACALPMSGGGRGEGRGGATSSTGGMVRAARAPGGVPNLIVRTARPADHARLAASVGRARDGLPSRARPRLAAKRERESGGWGEGVGRARA